MRLKKSTWLLLFLAFSLGGWVYFYEIKRPAKLNQIKAQQQQIFDFTEDEVQKITITKPANILKFVRTENSNQLWQMKQPQDAPASNASITFLLDLVTKGKSDRSFSIPISDLSKYGLNQSATKITIELKNQESHNIILGNANLSDRLVYAQVNYSANSLETTLKETTVILVPKNWHYAVDHNLSEWKQTP